MKSDQQLQMDVLAELQWDPRVQSNEIGVIVKDGAVTLTGTVSAYAEKLAAARAAKRVRGVRAVVEEIEVRIPAQIRSTDEGIGERVAKILQWNIALRDTAVQAEVKNGHVTLSGEVQWPYQKQMAAHRVEELRGVAGITNLITIRESGGKLAAEDVRQQIMAALHRHATVEASRIQVTVADGKVALDGIVSAVSERDLVEEAVWGTAGVTEVVDRLMVR
jgi:osmotically-inducible protein OsmY